MELVRINKYLADKGYSTRRGADALISAGKVKINGRRAILGDKVSATDKIEVDSSSLKAERSQLAYYAYNKPVGVVTHSPQAGEVDILQAIKLAGGLPRTGPAGSSIGVFPLGRLDKESHGLILLTNDGRITGRLLDPEGNHEKEYAVRVNKPLKENTFTRLSKGIKIEGYITKPAIAEGEPGSYTLHLTITEGKKHQIRRMLTALGYEVLDLKRVRIMHIKLGDLKDGEYRALTASEQKRLLGQLGL